MNGNAAGFSELERNHAKIKATSQNSSGVKKHLFSTINIFWVSHIPFHSLSFMVLKRICTKLILLFFQISKQL